MDIIDYLILIPEFLNNTVLPLLMGIAFLFFIYNAFRYFVAGGASEDGRTKAKSHAIWGIIAFVLILSTWSIVNIIVRDANIDSAPIICPDYMPIEECIGSSFEGTANPPDWSAGSV